MTSQTWDGRRVLVSAGPTWAMIDAVRYLGNLSSGATGAAISQELAARGAHVTLLFGSGRTAPPAGIRVERYVTFQELHALVRREVGSGDYDAFIHAAAVSDYLPAAPSETKLPSDDEELVIRLRRAPKIVDEVMSLDPRICLVKFKLEVGRTENELLGIAQASRAKSGAALIVANDLSEMEGGRHRAFLLDADGVLAETHTNAALASALCDELERRLPARRENQ